MTDSSFQNIMSKFVDNLTALKRYTQEDADREEVLNLIKLNDYNLEYERVDPLKLKEYLKIRRKYLNNTHSDNRSSTPPSTTPSSNTTYSYSPPSTTPPPSSYANIDIHVESMRRKDLLQDIKYDAHKLITINKYISYLVEEKKEPIDSLLTNLEYSEIFVSEANANLEAVRKRQRRCLTLKTIGKVFVVLLLLTILLRLISLI